MSMVPTSSEFSAGLETESTLLSPSSQLTRQEKLSQEGVFGAGQDPRADAQGSAASDSSSLSGGSAFSSPKRQKPSQVSIKDLGKIGFVSGR